MNSINPHLTKLLNTKAYELKPLDYYIDGIITRHDFIVLAEAITLLESDTAEHKKMTDDILTHCFATITKSRRIGITGSPGVGKSTFIESITADLKADDSTAAILTIDPTSTDNRGSILGDKTRMNQLSQEPNIFIRPSPSRAHLGGVNAYTYEAIAMCEAAGIDLIIIETVGVGQSEHEIKNLVDCILLLLLPGAGDDLQGIKKGIAEIADIVVIHKADGERINLSNQIQKDYQNATHLAQVKESQWTVPIQKYSSLTEMGKSELVDTIATYFKHIEKNNFLTTNRSTQSKKWLDLRINQYCVETIQHQLRALAHLLPDINPKMDISKSPFELLLEAKKNLQIHLAYS